MELDKVEKLRRTYGGVFIFLVRKAFQEMLKVRLAQTRAEIQAASDGLLAAFRADPAVRFWVARDPDVWPEAGQIVDRAMDNLMALIQDGHGRMEGVARRLARMAEAAGFTLDGARLTEPAAAVDRALEALFNGPLTEELRDKFQTRMGRFFFLGQANKQRPLVAAHLEGAIKRLNPAAALELAAGSGRARLRCNLVACLQTQFHEALRAERTYTEDRVASKPTLTAKAETEAAGRISDAPPAMLALLLAYQTGRATLFVIRELTKAVTDQLKRAQLAGNDDLARVLLARADQEVKLRFRDDAGVLEEFTLGFREERDREQTLEEMINGLMGDTDLATTFGTETEDGEDVDYGYEDAGGEPGAAVAGGDGVDETSAIRSLFAGEEPPKLNGGRVRTIVDSYFAQMVETLARGRELAPAAAQAAAASLVLGPKGKAGGGLAEAATRLRVDAEVLRAVNEGAGRMASGGARFRNHLREFVYRGVVNDRIFEQQRTHAAARAVLAQRDLDREQAASQRAERSQVDSPMPVASLPLVHVRVHVDDPGSERKRPKPAGWVHALDAQVLGQAAGPAPRGR